MKIWEIVDFYMALKLSKVRSDYVRIIRIRMLDESRTFSGG